jgi:hypothetical protein
MTEAPAGGEVASERSPAAGRGFWIVAGALGLGCVLLVVQILVNRPIAETIAHAQHTLRTAQAAAEETRAGTGSFRDADAGGLAVRAPSLTFRGAEEPSTGLNDVSVFASDHVWAAAVLARADACFYLRLEEAGDPLYGVGGACTGSAAVGASDTRW